jgi:hypothetical protein
MTTNSLHAEPAAAGAELKRHMASWEYTFATGGSCHGGSARVVLRAPLPRAGQRFRQRGGQSNSISQLDHQRRTRVGHQPSPSAVTSTVCKRAVGLTNWVSSWVGIRDVSNPRFSRPGRTSPRAQFSSLLADPG